MRTTGVQSCIKPALQACAVLALSAALFGPSPLKAAPGQASARPASLSASGAAFTAISTSPDPGRDYLAIRKAVAGPFQSLVKSTNSALNLGDLANEMIEVSGRVAGKFTMPNGIQLIIETPQGSLNVSVASGNSGDWLETGSRIRALISVPDSQTLAQLHQIVTLIASAPEGSVAEAEQEEASAEQHAAIAAAQAAEQERAKESSRNRRQPTSRGAIYDYRANLGGGRPIAPLSAAALSVYGAYRSFVAAENRRLSARTVDAITTSILYYSEQKRLDPRLVIAMIMAESGFDPDSTSRTGAMGLGQLMPGTAAGLGVSDAYDPIQNIGAAVEILSSNVHSYGGAAPNGVVPINTLLLTMAAYNAGNGAVHKYQGVPPYRETRRYVRKVAAFYRRICGG